MTDRLETPKQLAERAGVSERQIRNLIQNGELDSVPIGGRVFIPSMRGDSSFNARGQEYGPTQPRPQA